MNDAQKIIARECLDASETDSMSFPQSVQNLMGAGFESYIVDLRRSVKMHYLTCGASLELPTFKLSIPVAETFDITAIQATIKEAQTQAPGYTYKGFCDKIARAGCAGYMVSFSGRRAVYYGRTAEIHTEDFPAK
jgi:uncharacterized protein YbcV (DUF1398 family)